MTRSSCISHPASRRLWITREEYVGICADMKNPRCAADLLSALEHWTNFKLDAITQERMEIEEAAREGKVIKPEKTTWIFMSKAAWKADELGDFYGETAIHSAFKELEAAGIIKTRNNPKQGWDRTLQYQLQTEALQAAIDKWAKDNPLQSVENDPSIPYIYGMESVDLSDASSKSTEAIPQDTTQDTESQDTTQIIPSPQSLPVPNARAHTHEGEGASLQSIKEQLLASFGQTAADLSEAKRKELDHTAAFLHERNAIPADVLALYRWVMDMEVQPKDPNVKPWTKPHTFSYKHLEDRYAVWKNKRIDLPQYYARSAPETFQEPPAQEPPTTPDQPEQGSAEGKPDKVVTLAQPDATWDKVMAQVRNNLDATLRHHCDGVRLLARDGNKFTIEVGDRYTWQNKILNTLLNVMAHDYETAVRLFDVRFEGKADEVAERVA